MMPEQIEQAPNLLARSERPSDRDLQRAALRDLVALASECARTETEIEKRHKTELEEAAVKLDKSLFVTEQRGEHLKEQVRQKYAEHIQKIDKQFQDELQQSAAQDAAMRQRIDQDFEKNEKELRDKLQQATWLAEDVKSGGVAE